MKFENLNDYEGASWYAAPNEDVDVWCELLQGIEVKRAAAICSGGEIGFFSLLPHVSEELVLVDHCTKSLSFAAIKYVALSKRGADYSRELFTCADQTKLREAFGELDGELPEKLRGQWSECADYAYNSRYRTNTWYDCDYSHIPQKLQKSWGQVAPDSLQQAVAKLDRVSFVHGDFQDVADKGPFDLLYLSNALEHSSRLKKYGKPQEEAAEKLVHPGGYILWTGGVLTSHWAKVTSKTKGGWLYNVSKAPEVEQQTDRFPVAA